MNWKYASAETSIPELKRSETYLIFEKCEESGKKDGGGFDEDRLPRGDAVIQMQNLLQASHAELQCHEWWKNRNDLITFC